MKITIPIILYMLEKIYDVKAVIGSALSFQPYLDLNLKPPKLWRGSLEARRLYAAAEQAGIPDWEEAAFFFIAGQRAPLHAPANRVYLPEFNEIQSLEMLTDIFLVLQEWDGRLKEVAYKTADFMELFKIARECLDFSFAIVNDSFHNVAMTHDYLGKFRYYPADPDKVNDAALLEFFHDPEYIENRERKEVFIYPRESAADQFICKNIFIGERKIGSFQAILDDPQLSGGEMHLFHHIASYIVHMYSEFVVNSMDARQHDEIHTCLRELLFQSSHASKGEVDKSFEVYGWLREHSYIMGVLNFAEKKGFDLRAQILCPKLESLDQGSVAVYAGHEIVWVTNTSRSGEAVLHNFNAQTVELLRDHMCHMGISAGFVGFQNFRSHLQQSRMTLQIGLEKHPHYWYYRFDDYILDYMMERICSEFPVSELIGPGLRKLAKWDQERGTDYLKTLNIYYKCMMNASLAADRCYVHRSTLIRRLEKIESITGLSLKEENQVLQLMISFQLLEEKSGQQ